MNLNRLNYVVMSGVLPFNFGMDYADCLAFYDKHKDRFPELCPTDPRGWTEEPKAATDKSAADEVALYNRLSAMPDEEFYAEVERLSNG